MKLRSLRRSCAHSVLGVFTAQIRNANTRRFHLKAVTEFPSWCGLRDVTALAPIGRDMQERLNFEKA